MSDIEGILHECVCNEARREGTARNLKSDFIYERDGLISVLRAENYGFGGTAFAADLAKEFYYAGAYGGAIHDKVKPFVIIIPRKFFYVGVNNL